MVFFFDFLFRRWNTLPSKPCTRNWQAPYDLEDATSLAKFLLDAGIRLVRAPPLPQLHVSVFADHWLAQLVDCMSMLSVCPQVPLQAALCK